MTSTEIKDSLNKLVTPYEVLQQIDQLFLEVATLRTRLQEAEKLLDEHKRGIWTIDLAAWNKRRDAWLEGVKS